MKEVLKILETLSDIKNMVPKWMEESYHTIKKFCPYRAFYKHSGFGSVYKCTGMTKEKYYPCGYQFCPYFLLNKKYLKQKGFIK